MSWVTLARWVHTKHTQFLACAKLHGASFLPFPCPPLREVHMRNHSYPPTRLPIPTTQNKCPPPCTPTHHPTHSPSPLNPRPPQFYNNIFLPEMEGHSASDLFGDEASATSSQRSSPSLGPPAEGEAALPPLRPLRPLRWQELEAPLSQGPSAREDLLATAAAAAAPAAPAPAVAGAAASMGAKAGAGEKGKGRKGERASGSGARRPLGQVDRNQAAQG